MLSAPFLSKFAICLLTCPAQHERGFGHLLDGFFRGFSVRRSFSLRGDFPGFSGLLLESASTAFGVNKLLTPVKNGWQLEQISTRISPLCVDRVLNVCPQAQTTFNSS